MWVSPHAYGRQQKYQGPMGTNGQNPSVMSIKKDYPFAYIGWTPKEDCSISQAQ